MSAPASPRWRRLLASLRPRSLAAQLLLGLLLGIALVHGIATLMLAQEAGVVHPVARRQVTDKLEQIARGATALEGSADVARVLDALGGEQSRFRMLAGPVSALPGPYGTASDPRWAEAAEVMHRELVSRLGLPPQALHLRIGPGEGVVDAEAPDRADVHAAVLMPGGTWLLARHSLLLRTRWWWPLNAGLQLSLMAVVLVAGFAVHRLLRPVRSLVRAAQQVSCGEWVPPLEASGPSEVRDVILAFNLMQERLRRFVDDRTRMLAAVSHDLRTPITSLRLRAELVDDPSLRQAMVRTLDEMAALVDESLRFGRDASTREATQPVSLVALVQGVVDTQRSLGHDVGFVHAPDFEPAYRCRPLALQRALGNLLDNAVRYGGRARVRLLAAAGEGAPDAGAATPASRPGGAVMPGPGWRIEVDDDGPGIPAELHEQAFLPFTQLHTGSPAPRPIGPAADEAPQAAPGRLEAGPGTGLGLAIARSCARAHGGELQLGFAPGGGLRATLLLPAQG